MTGFVYAVSDGNGLVKIGWSRDPLRRFLKIKSDCSGPARLLGTVPASIEQEQAAHALLGEWRVRGEWFRLDGAVTKFVDMLLPPQPYGDCHPVRKWRKQRRLTAQEFAEMLGVTRITVHRWETGKRLPKERQVALIAEKTGISARDLRPDLAELIEAGQ